MQQQGISRFLVACGGSADPTGPAGGPTVAAGMAGGGHWCQYVHKDDVLVLLGSAARDPTAVAIARDYGSCECRGAGANRRWRGTSNS